jgi:hypothetical protein
MWSGETFIAQPTTMTVNQVTPTGEVVNNLSLGEYEVVITSSPDMDTEEDSQFNEALQMRQLGIAIPDDVLVEYSHLTRKAEIAQRIRQATGSDGPSQVQQQIQQLEVQQKQMDVQATAALAQLKKANAAAQAVRAQRELQTIRNGGSNAEAAAAVEIKQQRAVTDAQLKQQQVQNQIEIDRIKMQSEIQLARERMAAELALKQAQVESDIALKEKEAQARTKQQEKGTPSESGQPTTNF